MRNEQTVKDIYKIAGMLEMMTCMQDHPLTSGMVAELADAVDKLELIGAELSNANVTLDFNYCIPVRAIDFLGKSLMGTDVNSDEGTEESPP